MHIFVQRAACLCCTAPFCRGCLSTAAAWACLQAEETGKPLPKLETVLHVDAASTGLPPPEQPPTSPASGQPASSSEAPPQAPASSSYKGAVAPQNEAERLSVLKGLGVLEEVPDLHLDRICEALVHLFKVAPVSALHCLLLSSIVVHQAMHASLPLQPAHRSAAALAIHCIPVCHATSGACGSGVSGG